MDVIVIMNLGVFVNIFEESIATCDFLRVMQSFDCHTEKCLLIFSTFIFRSNFITRLAVAPRKALLTRLINLAEPWGGKENGFGLAQCCQNLPLSVSFLNLICTLKCVHVVSRWFLSFEVQHCYD